MALVLASHSPRRRQLMSLITQDFMADEAGICEEAVKADCACSLARCLARLKALDVATRRPEDIVIGCDTVVEIGGDTLGKPRDPAEAVAMLERLSGSCHQVHTGVCLVLPGRSPEVLFSETTDIHMAPIAREAIAEYVETPEPYDKAGGYGIQGWAACHIRRIEGCYYNAMGLPVAALYEKLHQAGVLL